VTQRKTRQGIEVGLQITEGTLKLRKIVLSGAGEINLPKTVTLKAGREGRWLVQK
jgi:hypothetical protein